GQIAPAALRTPDHYVEDLRPFIQVANDEAGGERGRLAADVPWAQSVALRRGQVDLDVRRGLHGDRLDRWAGHAVHPRQHGPDLLRLVLQRGQVGPVDADD